MADLAEVKFEAGDTKEFLLEQKAVAEMSLLNISTKYQLVWLQLQTSPEAKELESIKSINLETQPLQPLAASQSSSQAYFQYLSDNVQRLLPNFNEVLNKLARETGVSAICAPIKPTKRATEKCMYDYDNDFSKLVDLGRGSVVAETTQMLIVAVRWILNNCEVIRLKNRFGDARKQLANRGGYLDVLINIKLDGFIFEIQLHLKDLIALKEETSKVMDVAHAVLEPTVFKLTLLDKSRGPDELIARLKALEVENGVLKAQNQLESREIICSLKAQIEKLENELAETRVKLSATPRHHARSEAKVPDVPTSASVRRILTDGTKLGFGVLQPQPSEAEWMEFVGHTKKHLSLPKSQYGLAWCLTNGRGLVKREHESVFLFRLAAEQGFAPAQHSLGVCYQNGAGVVKNDFEAVILFKMAGEQNYAPALCSLGACYQYGTGVSRSEQDAIRLYQQAVEQNYAPAQCSLGVCFHTGMGVTKNEQEASRLYRLAADQNFANAQYNLGVYYQNGIALEKNEREAAKLYRLAADQGFAHAQYALGVCFQNGTGVERNYYDAVHYYQLAAASNNSLAMHALGVCLRSGVGIDKDEAEGTRLIRLARRTMVV